MVGLYLLDTKIQPQSKHRSTVSPNGTASGSPVGPVLTNKLADGTQFGNGVSSKNLKETNKLLDFSGPLEGKALLKVDRAMEGLGKQKASEAAIDKQKPESKIIMSVKSPSEPRWLGYKWCLRGGLCMWQYLQE
ncbi:hypothetical protein GOBAR_DD16555 [Gossypium barbadense]|nr:hypothetical protein GOBAR_DD16555 [Gossypium barbadense]